MKNRKNEHDRIQSYEITKVSENCCTIKAVVGDDKKYTIEMSQRTFDPPKSVSYYVRWYDEDNACVAEHKIHDTIEV